MLLILEPYAGCSNYSSNFSDGITDSGMETIDLSDKVKLDDSCVFVDNSMLYEVSRRSRKLRSFKVFFPSLSACSFVLCVVGSGLCLPYASYAFLIVPPNMRGE